MGHFSKAKGGGSILTVCPEVRAQHPAPYGKMSCARSPPSERVLSALSLSVDSFPRGSPQVKAYVRAIVFLFVCFGGGVVILDT